MGGLKFQLHLNRGTKEHLSLYLIC